jgi:hypothetical protein
LNLMNLVISCAGRLVEFGETPSSSLTLDEFMSVELEEEHDPPSFKAARIRDRERLQKLLDTDVGEELKSIQGKIEVELDKRRRKVLSKGNGTLTVKTNTVYVYGNGINLSLLYLHIKFRVRMLNSYNIRFR